jgi:hypothetical protein
LVVRQNHHYVWLAGHQALRMYTYEQ